MDKTPSSAPAVVEKAVGSFKWSALAEICSKALSPLFLVLLARLLSPNDFGLVAVATLCVTFIQMLWEGGLGRALIHLEQNHEQAANVVFWTNGIVAMVAFGVLQLIAPEVATFLGSPTATNIIRALSLQILLGSLGSVHQALLTRDLNFKKLFRVRLISALCPGLVSIPLAYVNLGVWALVIGTLVAQAASVSMLWRLSGWRPAWRYDSVLAKRLMSFGVWVFLESIGAWLLTSGDNLVVGKTLGTHELGLYRTGSALVTVVFATLLSPILPVAYPTLCRLQSHPENLKDVFLKLNKIMVYFAIAIGVGMFLVSGSLAAAFFGSRWNGLAGVIAMLAAMNGTAWTVGLNAELYRAMGRPDINTKLMYIQLFYYLPAYWFGAKAGLETFCIVRFCVAVLSMPLHAYFASVMLKLTPAYLLQVAFKPALAACVMAAGVFGFHHLILLSNAFARLIVEIAIGASLFIGVTLAVDRGFVSEFKRFVGRKGQVE